MVANHAPASRFISMRAVRGETPGISANFTRYLPPSRARAENSTPVSAATDATQQITAFFRRCGRHAACRSGQRSERHGDQHSGAEKAVARLPG